MTTDVEPPASDELFDAPEGELSDIETAIRTAQHYHNQIDAMKRWSRETFSELLAEARVLEATEDGDAETVDQVWSVARLVLTVNDRVEEGDTQRVRQP